MKFKWPLIQISPKKFKKVKYRFVEEEETDGSYWYFTEKYEILFGWTYVGGSGSFNKHEALEKFNKIIAPKKPPAIKKVLREEVVNE